MSRIKLDTEQMYAVAAKYETQADNIDMMIRNLDNMLIELQTYWEGTSARKFEQNYLEIKPAIIRLQNVILETSKVIKHSASSFVQVDNTIIG